ncbi:hypothetical protein [Changchengzhania lutea]|uniref:hypothetical protein n=1 Tax=Changchengzhania lutea TaxID=2049305 RepID=UPI00115DDF06|nr:hypothetical protein [Changchengzhania lutea]
MNEIKVPFQIGQTVYLITDEEQKIHIVVGIIIRKEGVKIAVSNNGYEIEVYDYELTSIQNTLIKLGINEK